jgi:hypothetical protein
LFLFFRKKAAIGITYQENSPNRFYLKNSWSDNDDTRHTKGQSMKAIVIILIAMVSEVASAKCGALPVVSNPTDTPPFTYERPIR